MKNSHPCWDLNPGPAQYQLSSPGLDYLFIIYERIGKVWLFNLLHAGIFVTKGGINLKNETLLSFLNESHTSDCEMLCCALIEDISFSVSK